jgi:hypothetical protein
LHGRRGGRVATIRWYRIKKMQILRGVPRENVPRGRIFGAIMVCSGETFGWLSLIAGAVRATVEGKE